MLALGIEYLTGYVTAAEAGDREGVEWPPHPARVFMALAAAHFETGGEAAERAALEWLERQGAPWIGAGECDPRFAVTQFVPINDKAGPSKAPLQSAAGLTRERQPRSFARGWLGDERVFLVWPEARASEHAEALQRLCAKVTRVGHSSSLTRVWASEGMPEQRPNWRPDEDEAEAYFRAPAEGLLRDLEERYNAGAAEEYGAMAAAAAEGDGAAGRAAARRLRERFGGGPPMRLRPEVGLFAGYARVRAAAEPAAGTVFAPNFLVFRLSREEGPFRNLDLAATLRVTGAMREAVLAKLGAPQSEALSGHLGGAPAVAAHLSYFPLAFVGHKHADGALRGLGIALPRGLEAADRRKLLAAVSRLEELWLGALGRWRLERPGAEAALETLRAETWTAAGRGARRWATVTPYVFDRHPKAKDRAGYEREAAEAVRESWRRVRGADEEGNEPEAWVTPISPLFGAPAAHEFPRLRRKDGGERRHTHAVLTFARPVVGPILLGAGRFRGYGLFRPVEWE